MRTFPCRCGNRLFFDSTRCVRCDAVLGMCAVCREVVPLRPLGEDRYECGNESCRAQVRPCSNGRLHQVCNRTVPVDADADALCDYCELNSVIPDLSVPANLEKWGRLEAAKRRVLYGVEAVGYPIHSTDPETVSLRFEFKADSDQPVSTGHANGCITINLREADDVEREKARVAFNEPQRTLVGHFRHELGHYYWERLVQPNRLESFRERFGDEREPSYADAQQTYYNEGPREDWAVDHISAYASMHPWEDFAETFAAYLDMTAILATASHFELCRTQEMPLSQIPLDEQIVEYQRIGIMATEFNREIGLIDLLPQVIVAPVIEKMRFIHDLRNLVGQDLP